MITLERKGEKHNPGRCSQTTSELSSGSFKSEIAGHKPRASASVD